MLFKTFGKHIARLLSLIVMVLISVGFVAGIGSAQDKIDYSLTGYYKSRNVSDYIIKSNKGAFTQDEISAVSRLFPAAEINTGMSVDIPLGQDSSYPWFPTSFRAPTSSRYYSSVRRFWKT